MRRQDNTNRGPDGSTRIDLHFFYQWITDVSRLWKSFIAGSRAESRGQNRSCLRTFKYERDSVL